MGTSGSQGGQGALDQAALQPSLSDSLERMSLDGSASPAADMGPMFAAGPTPQGGTTSKPSPKSDAKVRGEDLEAMLLREGDKASLLFGTVQPAISLGLDKAEGYMERVRALRAEQAEIISEPTRKIRGFELRNPDLNANYGLLDDAVASRKAAGGPVDAIEAGLANDKRLLDAMSDQVSADKAQLSKWSNRIKLANFAQKLFNLGGIANAAYGVCRAIQQNDGSLEGWANVAGAGFGLWYAIPGKLGPLGTIIDAAVSTIDPGYKQTITVGLAKVAKKIGNSLKAAFAGDKLKANIKERETSWEDAYQTAKRLTRKTHGERGDIIRRQKTAPNPYEDHDRAPQRSSTTRRRQGQPTQEPLEQPNPSRGGAGSSGGRSQRQCGTDAGNDPVERQCATGIKSWFEGSKGFAYGRCTKSGFTRADKRYGCRLPSGRQLKPADVERRIK